MSTHIRSRDGNGYTMKVFVAGAQEIGAGIIYLLLSGHRHQAVARTAMASQVAAHAHPRPLVQAKRGFRWRITRSPGVSSASSRTRNPHRA